MLYLQATLVYVSSNASLEIINLDLGMLIIQISNMVVLLILIISVRITTQVLHISSSCAQVTTSAGELAMDLKHQNTAEEAGCGFILLAVETFSVWYSFA